MQAWILIMHFAKVDHQTAQFSTYTVQKFALAKISRCINHRIILQLTTAKNQRTSQSLRDSVKLYH